MTRVGRYWLFYVIVAVGLALSWGQIGRKTTRVLEAAPVSYLAVEANCYANSRPCAALSGDHALVLGPVDRGLMLRQIGFDPATVASVTASLKVEASDDAQALPVQRIAGGWLVPAVGTDGVELQIRLAAQGQVSVADYPLRGR